MTVQEEDLMMVRPRVMDLNLSLPPMTYMTLETEQDTECLSLLWLREVSEDVWPLKLCC